MSFELASTQIRTRVFLSYSRKDEAFTRRLAQALEARGFEPIFDRSEKPHDDPDLVLSAQDEWWLQLKRMIAAADVMIFIVTPHSAKSRVCDDEIAHAKDLGKRVIAILRTSIDFETAPERLRALNVKLNFEDDDEAAFERELASLQSELDRDLEWHRLNAHYARLAQKWQLEARPEGQLLRQGAIAEADRWISRKPRDPGEISPLIQIFLDASREKERADNTIRRRNLGRAFVKPCERALEQGRTEQALRLAATGIWLADDLDLSLVPELRMLATKAVGLLRTRACLMGHTGLVSQAAMSPDGRSIATACTAGEVRLWDAGTFEERAFLQGHSKWVRTLVFDKDGQRLLTASEDATARIWDLTRLGEVICFEGHEKALTGAAFSPNGEMVLTSSEDHTARLWDARTGGKRARLQGHEGIVGSARFSSNGARIVTTSSDRTAWLWNGVDGRLVSVLKGHERDVTDAVFCADDAHLCTASMDHTLRMWEAKSGAPLARLEGHESHVDVLQASPDGNRIASASSDHTVRVWDARSFREIACCRGHEGTVGCLSFSPDGRRLASGSWDKTARLWDASTGQEIFCLKDHDDLVRDVRFSPDGRLLLTSSNDRSARVFDSATSFGVARFVGHGGGLNDAAFSPDGRRIVTASTDASAMVWDLDRQAPPISLKGHGHSVNTAVFSGDGERVLTASSDAKACVWDAKSGLRKGEFAGHERAVTSAVFSPDGKCVLTSSADRQAVLWDFATRTPLKHFVGHAHMVSRAEFSPDGTRIATASWDGTARLWRTNGEEIAVLDGQGGYVYAAVFSPDGRRLITSAIGAPAFVWNAISGTPIGPLRWGAAPGMCDGLTLSPEGARLALGVDNDAAIWDATTGDEIVRLHGHRDRVHGASASPDGRYLVSASSDRTGRVWDVGWTNAIAGKGVKGLIAALAHGLGRPSKREAEDLLMQDAPPDLFETMMESLTAEDRADVSELSRLLRQDKHPNCYLSPSAFDEMFGAVEKPALQTSPPSSLERNVAAQAAPLPDRVSKFSPTRGGVHPLVLVLVIAFASAVGGVVSYYFWR